MTLNKVLNLVTQIVVTVLIVSSPALIPNSILWEGVKQENHLTCTGQIFSYVYIFVMIWCVDEVIGKRVANKLFPKD